MTSYNGDDVLLSIVIPAYNEEKRIGPTLGRVIAHLSGRPFRWEVIVVDDGSTDRTAEEAAGGLGRGEGRRLIRLPKNRGKGTAVKTGVLASRGRYVIFSDADLSTPVETIDAVLELLAREEDVVIGSRAMKESRITVRQSRMRECLGRMFNLLVRTFLLKGYRDTQCGFKGFSRAAAVDIFPRLKTEGFAFDVEVLLWGRELGYGIAKLPVVWADSRPSRVPMVGGSGRMFLELVRLRMRLGRIRHEARSERRAGRT